MAIYVDFSFHLGGTRLLIVGWGLRDVLGGAISVYDAAGGLVAEGEPTLSTHVRPDVGDKRAAGFVMALPLAVSPPMSSATLTLYCEAAGTSAVRYTGGDLESFVSFAGDEPFYTVLKEIAAGRLPALPASIASLIFERARRRPSGMLETPFAAASLDYALCEFTVGAGLVGGWVLPSTSSHASLSVSLVCLTPEGITGAETAFNAIERLDLAGFSGRYSVDGRTGFVASFSLGTQARRASVLLIVTCDQNVGVVAVSPDAASFNALAHRFHEIATVLDTSTRRRIRLRLSHHLCLVPLEGFAVAAAPVEAPPVLVLEHDGRASDLREVLAYIGELGWRSFDLVLLNRPIDDVVSNALDGAARDVPGLAPGLVTGNGLDTLETVAGEDRAVVYLRSSILMQSDAAEWLIAVAKGGPVVARLLVCAPGRRAVAAGSTAALVADVARKGLPFAGALRGGPELKALVSQGRGLLTVSGWLLWTVRRLPEAAVMTRILRTDLFIGEDIGDGAVRRLPGGRLPIEFDLETIAFHG